MKSIFTEKKITYHEVGDYFLPVLTFSEQKSIGVYGQRYKNFLKANNPVVYTELLITGKLWPYLADLNEQTQNIIEQMKTAEGVTEDLKAADQMAWVGAMNSIRSRAEEIILQELICEVVSV